MDIAKYNPNGMSHKSSWGPLLFYPCCS